mmetsp:Transcript_2468/g.2394  ORF Transcript_2468/g.2394 Transcript_2468/m.2394 type:complete len:348 (-) Transcript_2468:103-1146(-)
MTESLFDTKFTSEPSAGNTAGISSEESPINNSGVSTNTNSTNENANGDTNTLPSINDNSNSAALINYRVLVSAKESGCLIGQNGAVIDSIREETNTKAGISKLQPGSHERILTVSGTLDDCAKALSYFAQALCNANIENLVSYSYFPLKQLSLNPCVEGETTILRLLIPNAQMGTLIGSKGARIQQIQASYNISMIASKSFLPGSNERLVELQGTVDNLYDSLRIISRCLIEDFSSIVGTSYYVPKASNYARNYNQTNKRLNNQSAVTTSISFANDMVGALIGKNGSRIQGVRKVSGATIGISDEVEGKPERIFTISGTTHAVEKAKSLLYHNLEREEQRRAESESK